MRRGARPPRSCTPPSTRGSTSSTPPTSTAARRVRGDPRPCARPSTRRGGRGHQVRRAHRRRPGTRERAPAGCARPCDDSLRRLGTDRIDLYQQHMPDPTRADRRDARGARRARAMPARCARSAAPTSRASRSTRPRRCRPRRVGRASSTLQNQLQRAAPAPLDDVVRACVRHGLGMLPYFPLASGLLTGKYEPG